MNVKRCLSLSCVLALACSLSVYAGPKCGKSGDKTTTVKADAKAGAKKGCCGKAAKTVAADAKEVAKKGCCGKSAKEAKLAASKKGCASKCGSKGDKDAKTVADMPCHSKKGKLASSKKGCGSKCGSKGAKTVLASLPAMTYRVGDYETQCHKSASAKAEDTKAPIAFLVEGKSFDDEAAATNALASAMEARVDEMSHIQFVAGKDSFKCPVTADGAAKKANTKVKYRLAGVDFNEREKATAVAEKVEKALADMKMTMMSEGKAVKCAKSCKKAGKKVTYVVGDDKTCCEKTAKLMLAERKIETIVKVVAGAAM